MKLNEYQERAMQTCMPTCMNYSYMMGNLGAEGKSSMMSREISCGKVRIGMRLAYSILN